MILSQFQTVGRDLFTRGLVSSHSGNLSIRLAERIVITRRGSMLGSLGELDLIETGVIKNDRATPLASIELPVHRAIYHETPALAVVHAHPPHAIALSMAEKEIVPGAEGLAQVGRVPVLTGEKGSLELAQAIARALKQHRIVMVQGHGSFAIGQLLEEAYSLTTAFEESCQIACLLKSFQVSSTKSG
jgi:L-fuculose-phosphate aldolase